MWVSLETSWGDLYIYIYSPQLWIFDLLGSWICCCVCTSMLGSSSWAQPVDTELDHCFTKHYCCCPVITGQTNQSFFFFHNSFTIYFTSEQQLGCICCLFWLSAIKVAIFKKKSCETEPDNGSHRQRSALLGVCCTIPNPKIMEMILSDKWKQEIFSLEAGTT